MIRRATSVLPLLLAMLDPTATAQEPGRAYKVAFWFELDRPLATARHRAYDLAKGEYDAMAVDRWRRTILESHPRYGAVVRDLTTSGEPGATEAERLAGAIDREKRRWADLNSRGAGPVPRLVGPAPTSRPKRDRDAGLASFTSPSPGSPGPVFNPPTSPFPYPYRSGPR